VKKRLTILTEIIAPYRIPVFNILAKRNDLDLHVIFLAETDPSVRQWQVYKNEIQFSYEVLPSWRLGMGQRRILINRGIQKALSRCTPDVVLCGGYNYAASWQALRWARRNRKAFLVWIESTAYDQRGNSKTIDTLKRWFAQSSSGAVVPGKSSFEYARSLGVPAHRIFHAPNAVDNDLFARGAKTARENALLRSAKQLPSRFFLFVGRLIEGKGVFDLLEAYGKLALRTRQELGLVFAGDGQARAELIRGAVGIRPGMVQFPGFVQREELPCFYGLAEAFVFPTHSDPWGLVVNEAMACDLPVITSSVAGCAADLVTDGWNGRIVAPRDIAKVAIAMQELADKPQLRAAMAQRSGERIRLYSPGFCADGIAQAFLSVQDSFQ
jgi:glycosyltransferase involved in cell wall biosynthesis